MSDNERKGFYVVIPAIVRMCGSIPDGAKLLFGDLCGLAKKEGYCYATNKALAEITGVKTSTVRDYLRALEEAGFITREKGELRRIFVAGVPEICRQPLSDIQHHTNTSLTNTITIGELLKNEDNPLGEIASYFHFDKGLGLDRSCEQADAFIEYHEENKTNMANGWKRHASTWFRNGVKFGKIVDPGKGKTAEEIANPDTGLIDTSRWELRGKLYYRR